MNALTKSLSTYAAYHRDPRNIATHFIGVPMIVLAVTSFLSRPAFDFGAVVFSPAWVVVLAASIFYWRLDVRLGLTMSVLLALSAQLASIIAARSTGVWLAASAGLFIVGWAIQFVGHYFEGRKPAFVDDVAGLLVGPLFVTTEVVFALGLRAELKAEVEKIAGPVRHAGRKSASSAM
jgi:uncharacterized membrane protein YGL010W